MSEQKDNIKNGKNIDLDGVTVRNDLSVAEKVEEKKSEEEVKAVEADANASTETSVKDEIKPDVVVAPEAKEETSETPVSPAPSINVQEEQSAQVPPIPIDIDAISQQLGNESENPTSVDLNVSQVNNPTVQTPVQDFTTPSFDTPSMPDASVNMNDSNNFPSFESNSFNQENDYNNNNSNLFNSVYDNENLNEKVTATIVTEEDEKNARSANLKAYADLYDLGPGKQISILRHFSEEAAKWVKAADRSGFVSGEMHDMARKILREYEGLKSDENQFSDDIPFQNNYSQPINQFNGNESYQNNADSKVIPFESNNSFENGYDNNQNDNGLKIA